MTYVGDEQPVKHDYDETHELAICKVCGGAEGSLTIDCPEKRVSYELGQAVYAGRAEFVRGRWYVSLAEMREHVAILKSGTWLHLERREDLP